MTMVSAGMAWIGALAYTLQLYFDFSGYSDIAVGIGRLLGVDIVQNIMVDAQTTSRWYFVVAMGRKAGHLALGIGKAPLLLGALFQRAGALHLHEEDDDAHQERDERGGAEDESVSKS